MKFKKDLAVLLIALAPIAAIAADGTINFSGVITDQTCTITSPQGKDFTVTLPTISAASLASEGAVAGRTKFAINLSNCKNGKAATYFEPGATVDMQSGRLINQQRVDTASGVQIQLLNAEDGFLPVLSYVPENKLQNSQWVDLDDNGGANLNYAAEYYAADKVSAGKVSASVKYTIIYN